MAIKRFINIIIAPEDRADNISFRLPLSSFYAISVILSILFVGVILLIFNQAMDEAKLGELELLKRHNAQLKLKQEKVAELEAQIHDLELKTEKLLVIAGYKDVENRELKPVDIDEAGNITLDVEKRSTMSDSIRNYHSYISENPGGGFLTPSGAPLGDGWLSRGFGEKTSLGPRGFHPGVDYAVREGSPVNATAEGIVVFAGDDPVYGKLVIIEHGLSGYSTFYGHCSELKVKVGNKVKKSTAIAASGNTGESSAPHLHYEVRLHGIPLNPIKYITRPGEFVVIDVGTSGPQIIPAKEVTTTIEDAVTDDDTGEGEMMDDGGGIPEPETGKDEGVIEETGGSTDGSEDGGE
ncbi:MAG: peptidoglycan DD-metalloendopeptidase family protein [bacterium]|nr:peptidoglycan DD-metalloendopeptidase family protein [bacterium]